MKKLNKQPHLHTQTKQYYKMSHKQDRAVRVRNDHSIQAKSPLKIPSISIKKDDLTFRNKTEQAHVLTNQFTPDTIPQPQHLSKSSKTISKHSIKLNLNNLNSQQNQQTNPIYVSQTQHQLINNMWQICNKLTSMNNQYIVRYLQNIQNEIRRILTLIAQQNIQEQAPLASSKKIKLQNCIAYSHCQKQINHKQYQSQLEQQQQRQQRQQQQSLSIDIDLQLSMRQSQNKDIQQMPLSTKHTPKDYQTTTHELQMKKIMYMLDGKQKNSQINNININNNLITTKNTNNTNNTNNFVNSNKVFSERISNFSSFNQNSSDDSGFTVFQISRYSDNQRMSKSSIIQHTSSIKKQQHNQQNIQRYMNKIDRNNKYTDIQVFNGQKQNKRYNQDNKYNRDNASISQDMYQSCNSQQISNSNVKNNMSIGTKRKVLNDIVTMLNLKYNKNIRLE